MMLRLIRKTSTNFSRPRLKTGQSRESTITIPNIVIVTRGLLNQTGNRHAIGHLGSVSSRKKCLFVVSRLATNVAKEEQSIKNGNDSALLQAGAVEVHRLEPVLLRQHNFNFGRNLAIFSAGAGATGLLLFVGATTLSYKEGKGMKHTDAGAELWARVGAAANKLWVSAAEVGKGVTNVLISLSDRVNSVVTEAVQTGVAAIVLLRCLNSILLSSREGPVNVVGSWWRLKVAALIADLAGANHSRRKSLVETGDGVVVDWLLEALRHGDPSSWSMQGEAARAIAHLLSDTRTCERVLGRPNALSHLFLFTASIQPQLIEGAKHKRMQQFHDLGHGRSLLVAAIMDIITSSCDIRIENGFQPKLPANADARDIASALKVIEEGGLHLDEGKDADGNGVDNGGLRGIGIRVLGGTGVIGLQRVQHAIFSDSIKQLTQSATSLALDPFIYTATKMVNQTHNPLSPSPGLWDDLQGRYVAVPLAAWALATWAQASSDNRSKIMELDRNGDALLAAVLAPERTVKWHGAATIHFLLEDAKISVDEMAATWSSALLNTAVQAINADDASLAQVAVNAFSSCIRESATAQKMALENNLPMMHALAKQTQKNSGLQKALVHALEVLSLTGLGLPLDELKRWSGILLSWVCNRRLEKVISSSASRILTRALSDLGQDGIPISQTWLALLIMDSLNPSKSSFVKESAASTRSKEAKAKGLVQSQTNQSASQAATQLLKLSMLAAIGGDVQTRVQGELTKISSDLPMSELFWLDVFQNATKTNKKDLSIKATAADTAFATAKGIKALTELAAEDKACQQRILDANVLVLLRRFMLNDDYEQLAASETNETSKLVARNEQDNAHNRGKERESMDCSNVRVPQTAHIRKHATRLLSILVLHFSASAVVKQDSVWCKWLEDCANGQISGCTDLKTQSYARAALLNLRRVQNATVQVASNTPHQDGQISRLTQDQGVLPRYEDMVFLMKTDSCYWRQTDVGAYVTTTDADAEIIIGHFSKAISSANLSMTNTGLDDLKNVNNNFKMDVVFVHGLFGGPFKTWRVADDKASATGKSGLVEKIDVDAGRAGSCWPKEWLASDLPHSRLLTVKYKTNLSQWSGATLPLQEVSSMLLEKLLAAGVGQRPVVFITHSMGGLVVKQMLMQAGQDTKRSHLVNQTSGIVFYSCPHFGSKLADMPWRIGIVLRPAPTIGELRSGSTRLEELNRYIRNLHKGGLEVLSFSETKVTPLVGGYGGWALRMEVVPIESAYPGFGNLVVLDGTDHINSCKPLSRTDPAYTETLHLLQNLEASVQR